MPESNELLLKRIVDGDTFDTKDGTRHRLQSVNAPETTAVGSKQATELLASILGNGGTVTPSGEKDMYGRSLSSARGSDGQNAAYELVRQGRALPYDNKDPMSDAALYHGALDAANGTATKDPELANEYLAGILGEGAMGPRSRVIGNTFQRSIGRGVDNMEASFAGFTKTLGDITGIDMVSKYGEGAMERNLQEAARNPAEITSVDDIEGLDDLWTFAVEGIGEQLPQLLGDGLMAMTGAGVGAVAARRGAMKALTRQLGPQFVENWAKRTAVETSIPGYLAAAQGTMSRAVAAGMTTGARTGALASIYPQVVGETTIGLHAEGITEPGTALGVGALKAALEYLPLEGTVRALTKISGMNVRDAGRIAGRIMAMGGVEGVTEATQTVLDLMARNHHQGKDLMELDSADWEEIRTSAAKGAIVGGGITGAGVIPPAYRAARAKVLGTLASREQSRQAGTETPNTTSTGEVDDFVAGLNEAGKAGSETITTREGPEAIRAQLRGLNDGKTAGVFISTADKDSFQRAQDMVDSTGLDLKTVTTDQGMLIAPSSFDFVAYQAADADTRSKMIARLKGYEQDKSQVDPASAVVVRTIDSKGVELFAETVDQAKAEQARVKQARLYGQTQETVSLGDSLKARSDSAAEQDARAVEPKALVEKELVALREIPADLEQLRTDLSETKIGRIESAYDGTGDTPEQFSDSTLAEDVKIAAIEQRIAEVESATPIDSGAVSSTATPEQLLERIINGQAGNQTGDAAFGNDGSGSPAPTEVRGSTGGGGVDTGPGAGPTDGESDPRTEQVLEIIYEISAAVSVAELMEDLAIADGKPFTSTKYYKNLVEDGDPFGILNGKEVNRDYKAVARAYFAAQNQNGPMQFAPTDEHFALVDEMVLAEEETAKASAGNNRLGEKQAETTRQGMASKYPTMIVRKIKSGMYKGTTQLFKFVAVQRMFLSFTNARKFGEAIEQVLPNARFEPVKIEGTRQWALQRFEVTDPAMRKEVDDASQLYYDNQAKIVNGGFTALRNYDLQRVLWMRNMSGVSVPLLAPSITSMGMRVNGDQNDVDVGFWTGVEVFMEKGWTLLHQDGTAMPLPKTYKKGTLPDAFRNLQYSPREKTKTLEKTLGKKPTERTYENIESGETATTADVLASVDEVYAEFGNAAVVADEIEAVLESYDMDEAAQSIFLAAQGMDSGVLDFNSTDGEVGDMARSNNLALDNTARLFDEDTGEVLHPASDRTEVGGRPRSSPGGDVVITQKMLLDEKNKGGPTKRKVTPVEKTVTSYGLRSELAKWIERAVNSMGIKTKIVIVAASEYRAVMQASEHLTTGKGREEIRQFVSGKAPKKRGGYVFWDDGVAYILLPSTTLLSRISTVPVLAHELGHIAFREVNRGILAKHKSTLVEAFHVQRAKGRTRAYLDADEGKAFEEWFADEFSSWLVNRSADKRTLLGSIMGEVNRLMRAVYTRMQKTLNPRLRATDADFKKFMADLMKSSTPFSGVLSHTSAAEFNTTTVAAGVRQSMSGGGVRQYFGAVKEFLANGEVTKMLPFIFTADRELRSMGDIGTQIANMFSQQSSSVVEGVQSYFQGVANQRARWNQQWDQLIEKMGAKRLAVALKEISEADDKGDPAKLSADAQTINTFFQSFHGSYLVKRMKSESIGKLKIYFPRMYDIEAVESRKAELVKLLVDETLQVNYSGVITDKRRTRATAAVETIVDRIIESGGSPDFNFMDGKVIAPGFSGHFARALRGANLNKALRDAGFLQANDADVVRSYIATATKYGEFSRINGGPNGRVLSGLIGQLPDPASKERARLAIEGYMGRIGLNSDRRTVKAMSWVMVAESYMTLMFAAVASIPDLVGPVIRSRDLDSAKVALAAVVKSLTSYGDAKERARLIGVLNQRMTHQALKEAYGQSKASTGAQRALDKLFRWNGQETLTNFSRVISATVAEEFLVSNAHKAVAGDVRAIRYLKELNVTAAEMQQWDAEGRVPWSPDHDTEIANKVQDAIYQFIDESVIRPNASQRPIWANHPMLMLLWHLKSFFWAYGKVVLGGMAREAQSRYKEASDKGMIGQLGAAGVPFAIGGMMLLPFAALARELREEIQYWDEEEEPTNRQDLLEYTWGRMGDAGIFGPFELVAGATRYSDDPGDVAANLAGPAFQHLAHFAENGFSWVSLKRATPIMNQVPFINDYLKEAAGAE